MSDPASQLEKRYAILYDKMRSHKVSIYKSVVSHTRKGEMDMSERRNKADALPIRVPTRRIKVVDYSSVLDDMMKREKRRIHADEYRKKRFLPKNR